MTVSQEKTDLVNVPARAGQQRILLATDSFLPHSGGSRVYYYQLYRNLVEIAPYQVQVATTHVQGWEAFDALASDPRMTIVRRRQPLPNWRYEQLPHMLPVVAEAMRDCSPSRFEWLHCGDLFPQGLAGCAVRTLRRVPFLMYCHGDEISQTNQRRIQPLVRNLIYRKADIIIAANEYARQHLLRIGIPEDHLHKILPGVDTRSIHPAAPRAELIAKHRLAGRITLLTVARLVPRKGVHLVIGALPEVIKRIPMLRYLVVGEGPQLQELMTLVRDLGLQDTVEFVGDIPSTQIVDYYNLCDAFTMMNRTDPSGDIESFGMVFVEANAAGKPVLGGRSGGTAEAVQEGVTGLLANPECKEDIVAKLSMLLQDRQLRSALGAAGLARVRQDFTWRSRAEQLDKILRRHSVSSSKTRSTL